MKQTIILGERVVASDPCYDYLGGFCRLITDVRSGTWNVSVNRRNCGIWGVRNTSLIIRHEDYPKAVFKDEFNGCGVDSGQCGFYDYEYYLGHYKDNDWDDKNSWYRKVCDMTLGGKNWGVMDGVCVVSESGYGDGYYPLLIARNEEGQVVGMKLKFV